MDDTYNLVQTQQWLKDLQASGFTFPNTYVVFDMETTGAADDDLIVQLGHIFVEDGRLVRPPSSVILNWTASKSVSQPWLKDRLLNTWDVMKRKGSNYRFSYDVLQQQGKAPLGVLESYYKTFKQCQELGFYFVAHNGYRFDTRMLERHFARFLDKDFRFDKNKLIDTGLFEKAIGIYPTHRLWTNDNIFAKYASISDYHSRAKWSLTKHCIQKYGLEKKHGLDLAKSHNADFDCYVTHLLYQEYRKLATKEPANERQDPVSG